MIFASMNLASLVYRNCLEEYSHESPQGKRNIIVDVPEEQFATWLKDYRAELSRPKTEDQEAPASIWDQ